MLSIWTKLEKKNSDNTSQFRFKKKLKSSYFKRLENVVLMTYFTF